MGPGREPQRPDFLNEAHIINELADPCSLSRAFTLHTLNRLGLGKKCRLRSYAIPSSFLDKLPYDMASLFEF